jgi:hypothetical protein
MTYHVSLYSSGSDVNGLVLQVLQRRLSGKAPSLREDQHNPALGTLGYDPG